MTINDPRDFDNFACPPMTQEKTADGNVTKEQGEYWWQDVADSGTTCDEFCFCSGNDGEIRETGMDNITSNSKLLDAFMIDCATSSTPAVTYFV